MFFSRYKAYIIDIIGNNAQECKKFVFAVKRLRDEGKNTLFALLLSRKFLFPIMSNDVRLHNRPMKISEDEVRYVAQLARLRLEENQIHEMSDTLSKILTYMDKLNEVDTSDVSPTSHVVKMDTVFREDNTHDSFAQDDALQNAPDRVGAFYRVPKIIE